MSIFHFIQKHDWIIALESKLYEPHSLKTDGFIHCCTQTQINGIGRQMISGQKDLLLLEVDEELVKEPIIYEDLYELNQMFPHLYGVLNLEAITRVYQVDAIVDDQLVLKSYEP